MQLQSYIPLDKSWMIRLGILDLLHGFTDTEVYLFSVDSRQLGSDLLALLTASQQWRAGAEVNVGESGTLYRFLQFAAWKTGKEVRFIKEGTLSDRKIVHDPDIVNYSLAELLKLDNGSSQWASIAVLMGNNEPQPRLLPYKLAVTYEARAHWQKARSAGKPPEPRFDQTILKQAKAYRLWLKTGKMHFVPQQAEDYCFARAFDLMTAEEGERRWPSLRQHESDRIICMEQALEAKVISSADHRIVQAIAMKKGKAVRYIHPEAVAKSWPLFWEFIT